MSTTHEERIWGERYTERTTPDDGEEAHSHDIAFLACLDIGLLELRSRLGAWVIFPKTVTFVPAGFAHVVRAMSQEASGWILYLPASRARGMAQQPHVVEMSELFHALSQRIVQWGAAKPPTAEQERIMAVALDELASARPRPTFDLPLPTERGLQRVADAILRDPSDMGGIDRWAKLAAMSRRSFTRKFTEQTGLAFGAWRHRVKIHEALRLLGDGASVTDVGFKLGYGTTSAFIAMFQKCVGTSPAQCARALRKR